MKRVVLPVVCLFILLNSCKKTSSTENPPQNTRALGWNGQDDPSQVPQSINNQIFGSTGGATPSSVDLTPYLPPIGDQGQTGTCVAWASGYYARTAADAVANNYNPSQLSSPGNLFSPKHIFTAIADNLKGADCNGTQISVALDLMQNDGAATLAAAPFDNLGNCSSSLLQASWAADALNHKISNYRAVDKSVDAVKVELAKKNPVIFGARLPDQFLSWQGGSQVLSGQATYNQNGGGHAMTIVGYDDAKQAFRIANSCNTSWGDNGYIWIDYNYMINTFVTTGNLYVVNVTGGGPNPTPNPNPGGSNVDLATWVYDDYSTAFSTGLDNTRDMLFDIYNIGTQPALSQSNWSMYLLYYNAYNANDYGVVFQDIFSNSIAPNTYNCSGSTCTINYSIPAGGKLADFFNGGTQPVLRNYQVPFLTGEYYIVLMIDPAGTLQEVNTQNNIFYTSGQLPKYFQGGYSPKTGGKGKFSNEDFHNKTSATIANLTKSIFNSAVGNDNRNAYTPTEIFSLINSKIKTGDFQKKLTGL